MAANYCHRCGSVLSPDASFCPNCGASQAAAPAAATYRSANCPNCGQSEPGDALFCNGCYQFLAAPRGVRAAGLGRRVLAWILDQVLFVLLLIIGYLIWLLFTARDGQTPAKRLLSIRAVRADGSPSDWGWTMLRELGIKIAVFGIVVRVIPFVGQIAWLVDLLWAFWDKNRQTLHDKIMKTVVIDEREYLQSQREAASGF